MAQHEAISCLCCVTRQSRVPSILGMTLCKSCALACKRPLIAPWADQGFVLKWCPTSCVTDTAALRRRSGVSHAGTNVLDGCALKGVLCRYHMNERMLALCLYRQGNLHARGWQPRHCGQRWGGGSGQRRQWGIKVVGVGCVVWKPSVLPIRSTLQPGRTSVAGSCVARDMASLAACRPPVALETPRRCGSQAGASAGAGHARHACGGGGSGASAPCRRPAATPQHAWRLAAHRRPRPPMMDSMLDDLGSNGASVIDSSTDLAVSGCYSTARLAV